MYSEGAAIIIINNNRYIRIGVLTGMGCFLNKNTFERGTYSKGVTHWKEGAKSNHYQMVHI